MNALPLMRMEPGWTGAFTRDEADGAIANGTVIEKAAVDDGRERPVGTRGRVLGSLGPFDLDEIGRLLPPSAGELARTSRFFYFVEWDDAPREAIGLCAAKVRVPA